MAAVQCDHDFPRGSTISKTQSYSECVILEKDAFDPDAVFLDDIVDDEVLPLLSLAVDGLTTGIDCLGGKLELRPEDVAGESARADTTMPVAVLDPEQIEVYGWESSLWRKICGYLGF
ncbi:MAG: hypothetical protein BMS9Abin32_022 [Gammaproteobacteria bacterium]|nr:MAG: hypothetical protein BMS9Abin32_022 [Gammaproteobacteria bacterium]